MKVINRNLLQKLSEEARQSSRKRKNLNFHESEADPIQHMLNAFGYLTYVQPHRHDNPPKREVFIVLSGALLVMFFNDSGLMTRHIELNPKKGNFAVEIEKGEWHCATALMEGTVVYEIKDGPYNPTTDKYFADWAPKEGDPMAETYLKRLIAQTGITINSK
jgi:cupin fold WbuC family metalloprotein